MVINLLYRIKERILRCVRAVNICKKARCNTPPRILGKVYFNARNLRIGSNVTLYPGVYLWGNDITIGDNVDIGIGTIIHSTNGVTIGDNTVIAGQCYIIDSNHGTDKNELIRKQESIASKNGISIGSDVWIAAQSSILKGAQIADHAVIGANSLVNSKVPEYAIVAGTPAKIIKYRN